jgi:hypothetical protein
MLGRHVPALVCSALGFLVTNAAVADEDEDEDKADTKPARCISIGSVQTTTIVDDDRILFYQRNGRIYLNSLDQTCVGLARSGKFGFKVQSGARYVRVCNTDTITVLERTGSGFSCGLGEFAPVSTETAAAILGTGNTEQLERAVEVQPVDLPKTDAVTEPKNE